MAAKGDGGTTGLRALPSVDALLGDARVADAVARHGRRPVLAETRRALDALRAAAHRGGWAEARVADEAGHLPERIAAAVQRRADGLLVPVLNATGVIVHTNLGRASLGPRVIERVTERAALGVNLEMELETGKRGRRGPGTEDLLEELTGAEAACVVNNAAAALVLALNTFALGREVVVSRGELVEIGGSFRVPDICERAGVSLVEVGTTNRTRLADFASALDRPGSRAAMILKVHPSNFRVVGFTEEAGVADLARLGRERGVTVVVDQGSGALEDLSPFGVADEPTAPELVAAGADLVLFSGDKLLGGPQAGCMVGRREAVEACRKNPLYRALRVGRLVQLALEATLWAHFSGHLEDVPVQHQLRLPADEVRRRAERLRATLAGGLGGAALSVEAGESTSGGGSSPTSKVPTFLLVVRGGKLSAGDAAARLRRGHPAVLARVEDDALVLDLRTVDAPRDPDLATALRSAFA